MRNIRWLVVGLAVAVGLSVCGSSVTTMPHTFTNGTVADADQVNANFVALQTAINDNATAIATHATQITAMQNSGVSVSSLVGSWYIASFGNTYDTTPGLLESQTLVNTINFTSTGGITIDATAVIPPLGIAGATVSGSSLMVGTSFSYNANGNLITISSSVYSSTYGCSFPVYTYTNIYPVDANHFLLVSLHGYGLMGGTNTYMLTKSP